jgi:hypothetical protein
MSAAVAKRLIFRMSPSGTNAVRDRVHSRVTLLQSAAEVISVLRDLKGLQAAKFCSLVISKGRRTRATSVEIVEATGKCASIDFVFPKQKGSCPRDREGA